MQLIDKLISKYLSTGNHAKGIFSTTSIQNLMFQYLLEDDNFKDIFHQLRKDYNPAYAKWYNENSKTSATGIPLDKKPKKNKDIYYTDVLKFNKQSLAFYLEVLPFFYSYILDSGLPLKTSYSFLDVGARTGAGANLYAELFSSETWGYEVKLVVDTIDINQDWNDYMKLNPFINKHSNTDLFDLPNHSYDICFCSHTIEHLDNPVEFVRQLKNVSRKFALISCPFNELNPIPGHHTITMDMINECNPKAVTTYKSVNRWKEDLECVIFIV